jgi:glycosyltransferase involved in cell wall biosynthesis
LTASPLISVIIPVFNGERFLAGALESVVAQDAGPLEIIVVDDGSTDQSATVAQRFPSIRLIRQAQQGIAGARNTGVQAARGDYLAFLDADDLWLPGKLVRQLECFAADPALDLVFAHVRQFREDGEPGPDTVLAGPVAGTMLIRCESIGRVGLFSTAWRIGEFMDWYMRAVEAGLRSLMLPEVYLLRRVHDDNIGVRERDRRADYVRIVKAALDRRRLGT